MDKFNTEILPLTEDSLRMGAAILQSGGVVAFGTETVYGLGANALDPNAVRAVFEAKGRPADNPLIVHLSRVADIKTVADIDPETERLLETIMPAPLTVILKKKPSLSTVVTAGLDTVGVRVPANDGARRLIEAAGVPIAAPSANTSTRPSPTTARHVYDDLHGKIPLILDTGDSAVGVESTVIDLSSRPVCVFRLGGMTVERLNELFGTVVVPTVTATDKPLAPGMKYRHYAPNVPLYCFPYGDTAAVQACADRLVAEHKRVVLLASERFMGDVDKVEFMSLGADDADAAHLLFQRLREAETQCDAILTFYFPDNGLGRAVNNRLKKASNGK